jgi:hypothetical protein
MSFEEYNDCFIWSCDEKGCDRLVAFKPNNFFACVDELKAMGWSFIHHDDGDWSHSCGNCNRKRRRTNIMDRSFKTVG